MPRCLRFLAIICLVTIGSTRASAAKPGLLELTVDDTSHAGRLLAKNSKFCWLMTREGCVRRVELDRVSSFRKKSPEFRAFSPRVVGDRMRKEFGRQFEIARTRHYVVCAPKRKAKQYAAVFEETWKHFHLYFAVRRFQVPEPEFPLTAVVFPDRNGFQDYCRTQGVKQRNYLGIYMGNSNRVALFEPQGTSDTNFHAKPNFGRTVAFHDLFDSRAHSNSLLLRKRTNQPSPHIWGAVNSGPEATIIHEATHQLAYNTGLHSRLGWNPRWIVERLATVFEAPGIRDGSKNRTAASRINRGRFVQFGNFAADRYKTKSLESFLASDKMQVCRTLTPKPGRFPFSSSKPARASTASYLKQSPLATRFPVTPPSNAWLTSAESSPTT